VWSNPWNILQYTCKDKNFIGLCPIQHRSNMLIVYHDRFNSYFFRLWYWLSYGSTAIKPTISLCCSVIKPMTHYTKHWYRTGFHGVYVLYNTEATCLLCIMADLPVIIFVTNTASVFAEQQKKNNNKPML
jgi:hypothetical protein